MNRDKKKGRILLRSGSSSRRGCGCGRVRDSNGSGAERLDLVGRLVKDLDVRQLRQVRLVQLMEIVAFGSEARHGGGVYMLE